MSENVGYATLQVIPSMKGFGDKLRTSAGREVDRASESSGKRFSTGFMGGFLGGAVSGGLVAIGDRIREFGAGAVDVFSEVEDATGAAGVVFGQSVGDITKFADGAAAKFGLAQGSALNAALTFGTLGKAAGKQGPALSGFATEMAGLAGDLASFRGTSTEQAVEAVGAALRGEMEPIRAYGVLLDDATLRQQALRMGLIKTTKEALTPQQKTLAAQAAILAQTKDAQGDFARTSSSTANTQKALQAATENAQAALGKKLAPAMTFARRAGLGLITGLTGLFGVFEVAVGGAKALWGWMQDNSTMLAIVGGIIGTILLPTILILGAQLVWLGTQAVISGAKQVVAWVTTKAQAIGSAAAQVLASYRVVAGWVLMGVQSLIQAGRMAAAWFIALGPIGWAIAAVIGIVALVIANWDKVKKWTLVAWSAVSGAVVTAWEWIKTTLAGIVTTVSGWLSVLGGILLQVIKIWTFPMRLALAIVVTIVLTAWNAVKGYVFAAVSFIRNVIAAYFNLYVTIIGKALGVARKVVGAVWGAIRAVFSAGAAVVRAVVTTMVGWVLSAINRLASIGSVVGGFFGRMVSAVRTKIGELVGAARGIAGRVLSAVGNLGSLLIDKGSDIVSGLIRGIGNMGGRLAGFVKQFIKDHIPGPVAKALGIASPSRVMAEQARWIPLGIIKGIDSERSRLDATMAGLVKAPRMPVLDKAAIGREKAGESTRREPQRITGTLDLGNGLTGFVDGVLADAAEGAGRGF